MSFEVAAEVCILGIDISTGEEYVWIDDKDIDIMDFLPTLDISRARDSWKDEVCECLASNFNVNNEWIYLSIYDVDFFADSVIITLGGILPYDSLLVDGGKWIPARNCSQKILKLIEEIIDENEYI